MHFSDVLTCKDFLKLFSMVNLSFLFFRAYFDMLENTPLKLSAYHPLPCISISKHLHLNIQEPFSVNFALSLISPTSLAFAKFLSLNHNLDVQVFSVAYRDFRRSWVGTITKNIKYCCLCSSCGQSDNISCAVHMLSTKLTYTEKISS